MKASEGLFQGLHDVNDCYHEQLKGLLNYELQNEIEPTSKSKQQISGSNIKCAIYLICLALVTMVRGKFVSTLLHYRRAAISTKFLHIYEFSPAPTFANLFGTLGSGELGISTPTHSAQPRQNIGTVSMTILGYGYPYFLHLQQ